MENVTCIMCEQGHPNGVLYSKSTSGKCLCITNIETTFYLVYLLQSLAIHALLIYFTIKNLW